MGPTASGGLPSHEVENRRSRVWSSVYKRSRAAVVWAVGWTAARTNRTGAGDAARATPWGRLAWGGRGYRGGCTGAGGMAGVGDTTPTVASTDPEGATMGAG